ncbi:MAG: hypothetical protein J5J06_00860 [Phycisphaerae bacterium]|nr:hypothetical protein [Phycisphaerae bacterium]
MRGHHSITLAAVGILLAGFAMPAFADGGSPAVMTVVPAQKIVPPGGKIEVHVFLSNAANVAAYELHLNVLGDEGGTLPLTAVTVDKNRKNFIFGKDQVVEAIDLKGKRAAIVTYGGGKSVGSDDVKYLATFVYSVPSDAKGSYRIGINTAKAFVSDANVNTMAYSTGDPVEIKVGALSRGDGERDRKR